MTTYLSHYTTRAGLEGIAQTKSFWATNFLDVNDKAEFVYALKVLMVDAVTLALKKVPPEFKRVEHDMDGEAQRLIAELKTSFTSNDGYGHLYMTSFARAANEDQDRRGILSLWRHYTNYEGYCLQFERTDVEHLLRLDSWKANYVSGGLTEVKYGVDKETQSYRELRHQVEQSIILQLIRAMPDIRIEPEWQKMWADSYLMRRLVEFCATHKDPCFVDEREVRIFGYPAERAEARVFTGIAARKEICKTASGKRYIVFGEHWKPGIEPRRIIIGPHASRDIESIKAMFANPPEIAFANMPVA